MTQRHDEQNDRIMFITTVTKDRMPYFLDPTFAREAIETLYRTQELHPFFLFGFCVMPDHIHLLVHVPEPKTISGIMNVWKGGTSHNIGVSSLWQRRFHMRLVKKPYKALMYIHENPVQGGLVTNPEDYPWSSACGKWDVTPLDAFVDF